jgi:SAM-dependent methyltransferase
MKKINCISCDSSENTVFKEQLFNDKYLDLIDPKLNKIERQWVKCNKCSFIFHNPQLNSQEIIDLYDKYRDSSFRNETSDEYFDRITSLPSSQSENLEKIIWIENNIKRHIESDGSILDIGSGGGVFLYTFLQRYTKWSAYGVDPTPEFSELARRKVGAKVHTGQYTYGLFNKQFDFIVCNQVLEHIVDPVSFLESAYKDLKKGGIFYVEVPGVEDFKELPSDHDRFHIQHLWYFSKQTLLDFMKKSGFTIETIKEKKSIRGRNHLVAIMSKD